MRVLVEVKRGLVEVNRGFGGGLVARVATLRRKKRNAGILPLRSERQPRNGAIESIGREADPYGMTTRRGRNGKGNVGVLPLRSE